MIGRRDDFVLISNTVCPLDLSYSKQGYFLIRTNYIRSLCITVLFVCGFFFEFLVFFGKVLVQ